MDLVIFMVLSFSLLYGIYLMPSCSRAVLRKYFQLILYILVKSYYITYLKEI